jgi:hypothetical protein
LKKWSSQSVSRVLSIARGDWTVISLRMRSPASSSSLPAASFPRWTTFRRIFGLAPAGVYHAVSVSGNAVGSYPTFSPLPVKAVCFLWHYPSHGDHSPYAQELPGNLSKEPGLSSGRERVRIPRPSDQLPFLKYKRADGWAGHAHSSHESVDGALTHLQ